MLPAHSEDVGGAARVEERPVTVPPEPVVLLPHVTALVVVLGHRVVQVALQPVLPGERAVDELVDAGVIDELIGPVAVVLIDEMELNQHPIWQRKLLHMIPQMGEDNQIIATTHSPYLRDAVRPDAVIDLGSLGDHGAGGAE